MEVTKLNSILNQKDWKLEKGEPSYSSNAVIDAYLTGKREGVEEEKKILLDKFNDNLAKALDLASSIIDELKSKKVNCQGAVLGADGYSYFKSIFFIDESTHIELNKLREIYQSAESITSQEINDTFYSTFSFLPYKKKEINHKRLMSDGFFMRYGKL